MIRLQFILLICFSFLSSYSHAQQLEYKKLKNKAVVLKENQKLTKSELLNLMSETPEALNQFESANKAKTWANILSFSSGFLIGYETYRYIAGKGNNYLNLTVGVGLFAIAVPLNNSSKTNLKQAVDSYNSSFDSSSFQEEKTQFYLTSNLNGLGIQLVF